MSERIIFAGIITVFALGLVGSVAVSAWLASADWRERRRLRRARAARLFARLNCRRRVSIEQAEAGERAWWGVVLRR